jgi:hypothetical protein
LEIRIRSLREPRKIYLLAVKPTGNRKRSLAQGLGFRSPLFCRKNYLLDKPTGNSPRKKKLGKETES